MSRIITSIFSICAIWIGPVASASAQPKTSTTATYDLVIRVTY